MCFARMAKTSPRRNPIKAMTLRINCIDRQQIQVFSSHVKLGANSASLELRFVNTWNRCCFEHYLEDLLNFGLKPKFHLYIAYGPI